MDKELFSTIRLHNMEIAGNYNPGTPLSSIPRSDLINWLFGIVNSFKLKLDSFFLAVNIGDRYLAVAPVDPDRIYLLGCGALLLSSTVKETFYPEIEDFEIVSCGNCKVPSILDITFDLFIKLQGDIAGPTLSDFITSLSEMLSLTEKRKLAAIFVSVATTLDDNLSLIDMGLLATAIIHLVTRIEIPGEPQVNISEEFSSSEIICLAHQISSWIIKLPSVSAVKLHYSSAAFMKISLLNYALPVSPANDFIFPRRRDPYPPRIPIQVGDLVPGYCKIGEGAYSRVYLIENESGRQAKKCSNSHKDDPINSSAINEIGNLLRLNHPNIIKLDKIFINKNFDIQLLMEYYPYDLRQYNIQKRIHPQTNLLTISYQIAQGLNHIHESGLIHRDIKPHNVFVDSQGNIKIGDLGLGKARLIYDNSLTSSVYTMNYRPPEILLGKRDYNQSADVWAYGCTIAELYLGKALFSGYEPDQLVEIFSLVGTPRIDDYPQLVKLPGWNFKLFGYPSTLKEKFPEEKFSHFLTNILQINPDARSTMRQLLNHPYFQRKNNPS